MSMSFDYYGTKGETYSTLAPEMFDWCKNEAEKLLYRLFPTIPFSIKVASRLVWRNLVLRATSPTQPFDFSVKIFLKTSDSNQRFLNESYFGSGDKIRLGSILIPPVIQTTKYDKGDLTGIIVRQWIRGHSLMHIVLNNFEQGIRNDLPEVLDQIQEFWRSTTEDIPNGILFREQGIESWKMSRLWINYEWKPDKALRTVGNQRYKLRTLIKQIENRYVQWAIAPATQSLCHGDPSGHEWIKNEGKWYWIDWENAMIHDPVADIAGLYHSLAHPFYTDTKQEEDIFAVCVARLEEQDYNRIGFYLLDRVISSDLLTGFTKSDEEMRWGLEKVASLFR